MHFNTLMQGWQRTQKMNTEKEHRKGTHEKEHRKETQKRNTEKWTFSPFPSQLVVNIFKFVYNESVLSAYIKPNVILM